MSTPPPPFAAVESKLGDKAGSLVGSAVANLCPQHEQAAKDYVAGR